MNNTDITRKDFTLVCKKHNVEALALIKCIRANLTHSFGIVHDTLSNKCIFTLSVINSKSEIIFSQTVEDINLEQALRYVNLHCNPKSVAADIKQVSDKSLTEQRKPFYTRNGSNNYTRY